MAAAAILSESDHDRMAAGPMLSGLGHLEARALAVELASLLQTSPAAAWRQAASAVSFPINRELPWLGPVLLKSLLHACPDESTRHMVTHGFVDATQRWGASMDTSGTAAAASFEECAGVFTEAGQGRGMQSR